MIQITPHMRILVAVDPIDFRTGIDGIVSLCQQKLQADPYAGGMFVFCSRRRTAIRVLVYDGQGFWMCHKRLSQGRFRHWPQRGANSEASALQSHELQVLLMAGDPFAATTAPAWRPLT